MFLSSAEIIEKKSKKMSVKNDLNQIVKRTFKPSGKQLTKEKNLTPFDFYF